MGSPSTSLSRESANKAHANNAAYGSFWPANTPSKPQWPGAHDTSQFPICGERRSHLPDGNGITAPPSPPGKRRRSSFTASDALLVAATLERLKKSDAGLGVTNEATTEDWELQDMDTVFGAANEATRDSAVRLGPAASNNSFAALPDELIESILVCLMDCREALLSFSVTCRKHWRIVEHAPALVVAQNKFARALSAAQETPRPEVFMTCITNSVAALRHYPKSINVPPGLSADDLVILAHALGTQAKRANLTVNSLPAFEELLAKLAPISGTYRCFNVYINLGRQRLSHSFKSYKLPIFPDGLRFYVSLDDNRLYGCLDKLPLPPGTCFVDLTDNFIKDSVSQLKLIEGVEELLLNGNNIGDAIQDLVLPQSMRQVCLPGNSIKADTPGFIALQKKYPWVTFVLDDDVVVERQVEHPG